jgi:hypothetical protein
MKSISEIEGFLMILAKIELKSMKNGQKPNDLRPFS